MNLEGLKVAAAVFGTENLGAFPQSTRQSILYVDRNATAAQRSALIAAIRTQYGAMLGTVRAVKSTSIDFAMALDGASVRVGELLALDAQKVVQVQVFFDGVFPAGEQVRPGGATKRLVHPDLAVDEELAYTPFIPLTSYALARAVRFENSDLAIGSTWNDTRPRMSVFTGTFGF